MKENEIEAIATDRNLSVSQRSERLTEALYSMADHGVPRAVEILSTTDEAGVAAFVSDYLALLPDRHAEKTRVSERLRGVPQLAGSASRMVPWLPRVLLDKFIGDYCADPDKSSPLYSVMFEIATFVPALLRAHRAVFDAPSILRGMLSGGPDAWIDDFKARWREGRDFDTLDSIARFRTPKAADAIDSLREEIGDQQQWECWVEMAGRLPDGSPSKVMPSFLGFATDLGQAPHVVGGVVAGQVPTCPVCEKPAVRILMLAASALPFALQSDPSFFWYSCSCNALDFTTVQERGDERRVFFGPAGSAGESNSLLPAECSLSLEEHPNQVGVSVNATGGFARHQVGGHPVWIRPRSLPHCPICQIAMRFLASIDSGMTPFGRTGFTGTLFGFWCNQCMVATTLRQA